MSLHDVFLSLQSGYASRLLSILWCSLIMFFHIASSYWCFPFFVDAKDHDHALTTRSECIEWLPRPRSPDSFEPLSPGQSQENIHSREICEVLSTNDLYHILGVPCSPAIDRLALRRAYLSRSKACHPEFVLPFFFLLFFSRFSTYAQQVPRKPRRNARVPKSFHSLRRAITAFSKTNVRRSPKGRPIRFLACTSLRVRRRNTQGRSPQHH